MAERTPNNVDKQLMTILSPLGVRIEGIPDELQENPDLLKPPSIIRRIYRKFPEIIISTTAITLAALMGKSALKADIDFGDPEMNVVIKTAVVGSASIGGLIMGGIGSTATILMGAAILDVSENWAKKINNFIL